MALQMNQPPSGNLSEFAAVDRVQSIFSGEKSLNRVKPRRIAAVDRHSHPNCAGWRRRMRHGSSIGSDPLNAMHNAKNLRAIAAAEGDNGCHFCKWRFFDRYLAQMANNGEV